jgi:hypothetical protein
MNGPAMNGPAMNGPAMNGPAMNGPAMNGPAMNAATNGPAANGQAIQAIQGPATRSALRNGREYTGKHRREDGPGTASPYPRGGAGRGARAHLDAGLLPGSGLASGPHPGPMGRTWPDAG